MNGAGGAEGEGMVAGSGWTLGPDHTFVGGAGGAGGSAGPGGVGGAGGKGGNVTFVNASGGSGLSVDQTSQTIAAAYDRGAMKALEMYDHYHRWWRPRRKTIAMLQEAIRSTSVS